MDTPFNIDKLLSEIIPPNDHQHREGFCNRHIIDKLATQERRLVERSLIKLLSDRYDGLIIDTLVYMKSVACLPVLYRLLDVVSDKAGQIIIASSIYVLNKDDRMVPIAARAWEKKEARGGYYFQFAGVLFPYLRRFHDPTTDAVINRFLSSENMLLASAARSTLEREE